MSKFFHRVRALFRRRKLDTEMAEEMRLHLELQTERNIAAGMDPDEARYAARRMFGGVEQIKEQAREQRAGVSIELFFRDLRHSVRSLARAPGFSLAVLGTLALCFGPVAAVFSALYTLVLEPMPFPQSEAIVQISNVAEKQDGARSLPSLGQYLHFREHADLFEGFAVMAGVNGTVGEESAPTRISVTSVSPAFFSLMRVTPVLGRFFTEEETEPGKDHVFVITESYCESNYAADPKVIGRKVWMDGEPYTIVGVAPRGFTDFQTTMKVFKPYLWPTDNLWQRRAVVMARVKEGVSLAAAEAQLEALNRALLSDAPVQAKTDADMMGYRIGVTRMREGRAAPFAASLTLLQAAAVFVLLIGCVNVTNLFLARTNARRPELVVRHALGAGRSSLLRQMLMESLLLTGGAAVVGLGLGAAMVQLLNRSLPLVVRWVPPVRIQPEVLWTVSLSAIVIGLVVGLVPFVLLWRGGLGLQHARTTSAGRSARWTSRVLVVAQVAIACVLLGGAGLTIRSFAKVLAVNPGFDATHVVQVTTNLPRLRYRDEKANWTVRQRLRAAFREIPGVESVAMASGGVERSFPMAVVRFHNAPKGDLQARPLVAVSTISPEYFETLGIPLLEGRNFTERDTMNGTGATVVVDETFVARYYAGRSPIGQELTLSPPGVGKEIWMQVVGVVRRAHLAGLEERDGAPFVYVPGGNDRVLGVSFLVRTERPVADVVGEMRRKMKEIDPALPVIARGSLQESLDNLMVTRRGIMFLLGLFAGLALLLAGVGLYGVLAYDVAQRTREIGIRGALGATRSQIVGMVLRQGFVRIGVGLVAGMGAAAYLTRFLRGWLFDVAADDPGTLVLVLLSLGSVGLLACWLPARRAAKVDPMAALRCE